MTLHVLLFSLRSFRLILLELLFFFFLMIRRPPRSTLSSSSAASDVYKRQVVGMGEGRDGLGPSTTTHGREHDTPTYRQSPTTAIGGGVGIIHAHRAAPDGV
eukprot:TRINITY_DN19673_c0_g1_i1.p1 TRINITY_DN19673_c0_g1~~TRINITY_DN19673_c0_g1_i1.p1  ORF type:complete len:102 (+),score=21.07 TRINITY_DN19673_c0_g1_i1:54-359(+)